MIKDGTSLTARIIWASQISGSLSSLPPSSLFHLFFCLFFLSLFLTTSPIFTTSCCQGSLSSPLFATISQPLYLSIFSLFCHLPVPPVSLLSGREGGMSYTAAYRQFLQDLEEKRGLCTHLQGVIKPEIFI